jgi:phospholipase C
MLIVVGVSGVAGVTVGSNVALHAQGGLQNIQHVVVIMQENRSFDEYFGKYPGANGIPAGVCNPDPLTGACVQPYHDSNDSNHGGGHGPDSFPPDVNGGRMDGYVGQYYKHWGMTSCSPVPASGTCSDVMGYKDETDIPNYYSYAKNYALQDAMFESIPSWSRTSHAAMVSGWSATCPKGSTNPMSCSSALPTGDHQDDPPSATGDCDDFDPVPGGCGVPDYAWTDITYLLHKAGVSWKYYTGSDTPEMWKPIGDFQDVHADGETANVQNVSNFMSEAASGTLPRVSWIVPGHHVSDHPALNGGSRVSDAESYVTSLVNAVMQGPNWGSSAVFVAWDDWGGFYDHVRPPNIGDANGLGLRVPGLMISPFAKLGYIDHQNLSFDSYLKFIEDVFLGGQRIDATDGRPDSRPSVRESSPILGDLAQEFDFTQLPRPPMFLPTASSVPGTTKSGKVQVSGTHYGPGETVTFKLDCSWASCPSTTQLGTVVADSNGAFSNFRLTVTGSKGTHLIGGVGSTGTWAGFNVTLA